MFHHRLYLRLVRIAATQATCEELCRTTHEPTARGQNQLRPDAPTETFSTTVANDISGPNLQQQLSLHQGFTSIWKLKDLLLVFIFQVDAMICSSLARGLRIIMTWS